VTIACLVFYKRVAIKRDIMASVSDASTLHSPYSPHHFSFLLLLRAFHRLPVNESHAHLGPSHYPTNPTHTLKQRCELEWDARKICCLTHPLSVWPTIHLLFRSVASSHPETVLFSCTTCISSQSTTTTISHLTFKAIRHSHLDKREKNAHHLD